MPLQLLLCQTVSLHSQKYWRNNLMVGHWGLHFQGVAALGPSLLEGVAVVGSRLAEGSHLEVAPVRGTHPVGSRLEADPVEGSHLAGSHLVEGTPLAGLEEERHQGQGIPVVEVDLVVGNSFSR